MVVQASYLRRLWPLTLSLASREPRELCAVWDICHATVYVDVLVLASCWHCADNRSRHVQTSITWTFLMIRCDLKPSVSTFIYSSRISIVSWLKCITRSLRCLPLGCLPKRACCNELLERPHSRLGSTSESYLPRLELCCRAVHNRVRYVSVCSNLVIGTVDWFRVVGLFVQTFYAWRIHMLSKWRILPGAIVFVSAVL